MNVARKGLSTFSKIFHSTSSTFLILVIGWLFLSLFPIGWLIQQKLKMYIIKIARLAPMCIHDGGEVNLPSTICIMMIARQSPMCIHDVAGKFTIYYPHHAGA
jgi:hypothetical protein